MAIRQIVLEGDDVLRKKCRPVTDFNQRLWTMLDDMAETLHKADGVGLAAPQVGILRRVVVVDIGEGLIELVNPVITDAQGEQSGPEGCLSVPGRQGLVIRPEKVTVKAQNARGEDVEYHAEGFLARAFCHELDHLDGILYVDKMEREIFPEEEQEDKEAKE